MEKKGACCFDLKHLGVDAPILWYGGALRVSQTVRFPGTVPNTILTSDTNSKFVGRVSPNHLQF